MITFEIKDANKISEGIFEVQIYCDLEGVKELQRQLDFLLRGETHLHLATPSWAGWELDEKVLGDGNTLVNQVRITLVPTEIMQ
jgi:hypothetical protein